jgi:phosphoribosylaminoimidazole-succinocarboxamide synthase
MFTPERKKGPNVLMEVPLPGLLHRGKVRDTFRVSDKLLLMVATDRISAFDVVLPNGIPNKGLVLNRISAFWFEKTGHIVPNHFVTLADDPEALDYDVDGILISLPPEVAQQAMVVRQAERIDVECIVRGYITGSAWAEYRRQGTVSGKAMPLGLLEGQEFPEPIFTPTTKAEEGHDQKMSDQEVADMVGADMAKQLERVSKDVYSFANRFAREQGIILADTKMEFGILDGQLILIDELLTPDSSRFWDMAGYAPGHSQPNFDKQFVRDWLTDQGWNQEPPAPVLPEDIVSKTSERYLDAYWRLTGQRLI